MTRMAQSHGSDGTAWPILPSRAAAGTAPAPTANSSPWRRQ